MDFDLRQWLEEEIGYEDPVKHRRNMFNKLVRLWHKHGLPVMRIIAATWGEAQDRIAMEKQVHWFLRSVKERLDAEGLWKEERRFGTASLEEILASGVFKSKLKSPLLPDSAQGEREEPRRTNARPDVFERWRKEGKI